jgi:hypothetical protein
MSIRSTGISSGRLECSTGLGLEAVQGDGL